MTRSILIIFYFLFLVVFPNTFKCYGQEFKGEYNDRNAILYFGYANFGDDEDPEFKWVVTIQFEDSNETEEMIFVGESDKYKIIPSQQITTFLYSDNIIQIQTANKNLIFYVDNLHLITDPIEELTPTFLEVILTPVTEKLDENDIKVFRIDYNEKVEKEFYNAINNAINTLNLTEYKY